MNTLKYSSLKCGILVLGVLLLVIAIPGLFPDFFSPSFVFEAPILHCLVLIEAMVVIYFVLLLPRSSVLMPKFDGFLKEPEEPSPHGPSSDEKPNDNEGSDKELIRFLTLLQKEGRLLDFLMQDISSFDDRQISTAARYVHSHCSQLIKESFEIQAVHPSKEGSPITILDENLDQYSFIDSNKPLTEGILLHRGWKANKVALPPNDEPEKSIKRLITPAQVKTKA